MPIAGWVGLEAGALRSSAERLMRVEARVKAQLMAATRALDATGAAKAARASSTGALLAGSFGGDKRAGDALVNQGKALEAAPATETALASGQIGAAQASIIAGAVAGLPDDATPEQKQTCEDTLIAEADKYSLKDLRNRSRRITDQFKPEPVVDQTENEDLEAREKAAWKRSEFWMSNDGDGTVRGGFRLPEAQADQLLAAVRAMSAPNETTCATTPAPPPTRPKTQPANRSMTAIWTTAPASAWDSPSCAPESRRTCWPHAAASAPPSWSTSTSRP